MTQNKRSQKKIPSAYQQEYRRVLPSLICRNQLTRSLIQMALCGRYIGLRPAYLSLVLPRSQRIPPISVRRKAKDQDLSLLSKPEKAPKMEERVTKRSDKTVILRMINVSNLILCLIIIVLQSRVRIRLHL